MISILDVNARRVVSLKGDEDNPSQFTIGMMDATTRAYVMMRTVEEKPSFLAQLNIVRFGLKGWQNVNDKAGNPIKFKKVRMTVDGISKEVVSEECLEVLTLPDVRKLSDEIITINFPTEQDEKNSAAPSSESPAGKS